MALNGCEPHTNKWLDFSIQETMYCYNDLVWIAQHQMHFDFPALKED